MCDRRSQSRSTYNEGNSLIMAAVGSRLYAIAVLGYNWHEPQKSRCMPPVNDSKPSHDREMHGEKDKAQYPPNSSQCRWPQPAHFSRHLPDLQGDTAHAIAAYEWSSNRLAHFKQCPLRWLPTAIPEKTQPYSKIRDTQADDKQRKSQDLQRVSDQSRPQAVEHVPTERLVHLPEP